MLYCNKMSKTTYIIRNYQHSDFDNYVRFRRVAEKREPSEELLSPRHIAEELAVPKYFPEKDWKNLQVKGAKRGLAISHAGVGSHVTATILQHPDHVLERGNRR